MKQQVNLEIMDFVEKQILPKYNAFGESHGLRHVTRVIRNSLKLVPVTGADIDMVYVIAAYHDLGMSGPRAIHHITSGKILQADARLKRWFNKEQIKIMKEAVEDHRASSAVSLAASMARLWQKPIAILMFTKFFCAPYSMAKKIIQMMTRSSNGSGSASTWTKNIQETDTSGYGFPTPLTRKRSTNCAIS